MLMANQQSAELTKPCVGSLYDPTSFISSEFPSIFVTPCFVVLPIGHDEIDAALFEPLPQRIRIVTAVGDYPFRLLPRPAFWSRHTDFGERGFRKRSFSRRGTFEPNSQRKTLTVDQYHPLRALATLGFTDCGAPFSQQRSCHPGRSRPTGVNLLHPMRRAGCAKHPARRLPLPTASAAANRSMARETRQAENATRLRFAKSRGCPRSTLGSTPTVCLDCPGAGSAGQQGLYKLPLFIGQQLLTLLHDRSSSANPPHTLST